MSETTSYPAAVITVSDRASQGTRIDTSGELAAEILNANGFEVTVRRLVPDEADQIAALLEETCNHVRLAVTTGGTGLAPRDVTPEATRSIIDREIPGLGELMRQAGIAKTPLAALSRGIVGARGTSLIVNLPGSKRAVGENLEALLPVLHHALRVLAGDSEHASS